jgi:hypothetical protein
MSPVAVLERHPRLLLQVQNRAGLSRPRHWPICDVPIHTKYLYHATTLESSCEEKTFFGCSMRYRKPCFHRCCFHTSDASAPGAKALRASI